VQLRTNLYLVFQVQDSCVYTKSQSNYISTYESDIIVFATGAEPNDITNSSTFDKDPEGFILVNDCLQSMKFPHIFAAGDCIAIDSFKGQQFPPKAGVFAVREAPIIAQNLLSYIKNHESDLIPYIPQTDYLKLIGLGNGYAVGSKFGITFYGKWVWNLKDHIDRSFMNLFSPEYLFGAKPISIESQNEFEKVKTKSDRKDQVPIADDIIKRDIKNLHQTNDEEYMSKLQIIKKMTDNEIYRQKIVENYF